MKKLKDMFIDVYGRSDNGLFDKLMMIFAGTIFTGFFVSVFVKTFLIFFTASMFSTVWFIGLIILVLAYLVLRSNLKSLNDKKENE